ncbi:Ogfod2 protein [Capsaspora owczarzaki ATCC 30864]|uniref:Ogfod2 protein, variant 1 n=1 Tax=Capsaspora owczarzaki (strain ATCC 30864) TaxID=595528 RepID=A0A0D2X0Z3_CAPO3|nr:Ogfod2 protein [Capsaspora owczarzaki ATCC 30864]KJE89909.1 Ogfod2 protein, variant 1 [Capsaspora owczarzaki ATCC 30864]|eukprot:XP_004349833.1 Ogfod2 protein [Capsaspora owczarzaki ATCC 30864]
MPEALGDTCAATATATAESVDRKAARVTLRSMEGLDVSLGIHWVTRERVERLFVMQQHATLLNTETLEIVPLDENAPAKLKARQCYMVVAEADTILTDEERNASDNDEEDSKPVERRAIDPAKINTMQIEKLAMITELYKPLHSELYDLNDPASMLEPVFLEAVESIQAQTESGVAAEISSLPASFLTCLSEATRLYQFAMLRREWCLKLVEELQHFEKSGMPLARPNSMNNYGTILNDIGFLPMLNELLAYHLNPLCKLLYPAWDEGGGLDHHHTFVVQYRMAEDRELKFHFDDAEVTLNVCLGTEFTGGALYFGGLFDAPETHDESLAVQHQLGRATLHLGKHRHAAKPITSGERYNMIMWMRNFCKRYHTHSEAERDEDQHHHGHSHEHGHGHGHSH